MSNGSVERPALEFIIVGIVPSGKDGLTVIGRNGDATVHLGDTFETLVRYKRRRFPEEMGDDPVKLAERPISLRVVGIQAYDREMSSLGQGMTGSLLVEGDDIGSLAPGWVLGTGLVAATVHDQVNPARQAEKVGE